MTFDILCMIRCILSRWTMPFEKWWCHFITENVNLCFFIRSLNMKFNCTKNVIVLIKYAKN